MTEDITTFQKPEDLCMWLRMNGSEVMVEEREAALLFRYMEGHDYRLGLDKNELVRQHIAEENGEIVPYSIDEVIDIVCEWNYELIEHATNGMANPDDFIDFCNYKETYDLLKEDEVLLDKMFARTLYGRELEKRIIDTIAKTDSVPTDITAIPIQQEEKGNREKTVRERMR